MELFLDILADAVKDTLVLVPFLFVTYVVLETLEHATGARVNALVRKAGPAGPVVGAILGIVPQCGFSAMGATLYAGRVVTLGTLVAVFLSTSDEMLPILLAEHPDPAVIASILASKALIGLMMGVLIDCALRVIRTRPKAHAALRRGILGSATPVVDDLASAGSDATHIRELCERAHCGCEEEVDGCDCRSCSDEAPTCDCCGHEFTAEEIAAHQAASHACLEHEGRHDADASHGHAGCGCGHDHGGHAHAHGKGLLGHVVRGAVSHTVQVTVFIFLVTLVLSGVLDTVGEEALAAVLSSNEVGATFLSALIGLIPNCAASIVITQLYLEGALSLGPMMAGSLVAAGAGFLVLFRTNNNVRENLSILVVLYVIAVFFGLVIGLAM